MRENIGATTTTTTPHLIWEDVTVVATSFRAHSSRKLLNLLNGCALTHRIMAIMGPSGSGKSTLLDALAGRLSPNVLMTGKISSGGCKNTSYTTQEDFLLGTLTVRETLRYSAHLRLPSTMATGEIDEVVEDTMREMGLQECADSKVGNWHLRGISGGEKRRLSISLQILTHPHVMFLDEPTTGLDSASAFFVIQALKNIALDGRIVVCSIHQPSSYTFELLDDLCLLSRGESVYFGEAKSAVNFFAEAGFPCPTRRSPSDHFLRCINSDFDKLPATLLRLQRHSTETSEPSNSEMNLTAEGTRAVLVEKYRNSVYSLNTRKLIRQIKLDNCEHGMIVADHKDKPDRWKQVYALTARSFVNMTRDIGYYWIRILFIILVSICAGTMYFDIGLSNSALMERVTFYAFFYGFLIFMSVAGLPSFIEEWKVSRHELLNGHYGEAVIMLSNTLSSFPFLAILSLSSGTIIYYMVKFHLGISHYCCFCINIFCCISIMEIISMIVSLLVPTFMMGIAASAGVNMFLAIASGLYRPLGDLPRFFWFYPMSYVSFTSWAVEGQYKNDMNGLKFDPLVPGGPKLEGEKILQTIFTINSSNSKWWDVAALLFFLLVHRIIFFTVLKCKDISFFPFHRLYRRRTLQYLAKRPSFRKVNYGSSRRQQPLHPLSAQEGFSSPLP
ncbi:hypothetical protein Tsubulata_040226 [Turnera subulata]|uniref:ABC transporter domain-containing protein n=1 Tax=Turnera subulata TaxID=218843 RepID=A0A9Q0GFV2_9ROSI|nr:hypothetical protein Tsubulata_040226 [Turnera subulata]